ncbi:MAG: pantoate--beta-alanine ligase, partial [Pseudomonadales bacterium]|nr:pantoate--beta-alanine ligase [Pseudomonadales bacterium]
DVEIGACPTVREHDGLALSSRNLNLDEASRKKAPLLHEMLLADESDEVVKERLGEAGFEVDYVVTRDGRRFAAARLGHGAKQVRLIDNVSVEQKT